MFFFYQHDIPFELLNRSITDEDINIVIGENGSGKSTLLCEVAKYYLKNDSNVIAIANTIYDKFPTNKKIKLQRAASGKSVANRTIKNALINLASDDLKRLRNVANTLTYIGFDPILSFQLNGIDADFHDIIIDSNLASDQKENILYFLNRYVNEQGKEKKLFDINFDYTNFNDLKNSYFITLFLYEKQLKALKLVSSINVYLRKSGELIPLLKASSGELTLVTTLIYITSTITENSIILIDEPENSLHPKWQTDYIKRLSELFYNYQPKIIVATHSPLVLNGAEVNSKNVRVFKGEKGKFKLHSNTSTNVEEIYQDFFDITTPENRFISQEIVEKMNLLSEKKINEKEFEEYISNLKNTSYDHLQKEALDGIMKLGREVVQEIK